MVIAGIKNRKIAGALANRNPMSENPLSNTLVFPGITHINTPIDNKNITIVM
jgi:hypothetical protein